MSYGRLVSPDRGVPLQDIEGDASEIADAGHSYAAVGRQMEWTADELDRLSDDTAYTAEALDAIRASAGELARDLHRIAHRYRGTGDALARYAEALQRAQRHTVDPLVHDIRAAHAAAEDADAEARRAQSARAELGSAGGAADGLEAERHRADAMASNATDAARSAQVRLDELWESFESGYDEWEQAYEAAVAGVQRACETSGVDDTWWEDVLDQVAGVATLVGVAAVVAAIVFMAPLAPVALVVASVAGFVGLASHVTMMAAGSRRVSMTDIAFDVVGVVPFLGAFARAAKSGSGVLASLRAGAGLTGATQQTLAAGRAAVATDLRSIAGAGGLLGGRAAREARADAVAGVFVRAGMSHGGRSVWNALRHGGSRFDGQLHVVAERMATAWPGGRAGLIAQRWAAGLPREGVVVQGLNVWNLGYGGYQSAQFLNDRVPAMPTFVPNPFGGR